MLIRTNVCVCVSVFKINLYPLLLKIMYLPSTENNINTHENIKHKYNIQHIENILKKNKKSENIILN